jgi:hypothetical protein
MTHKKKGFQHGIPFYVNQNLLQIISFQAQI